MVRGRSSAETIGALGFGIRVDLSEEVKILVPQLMGMHLLELKSQAFSIKNTEPRQPQPPPERTMLDSWPVKLRVKSLWSLPPVPSLTSSFSLSTWAFSTYLFMSRFMIF